MFEDLRSPEYKAEMDKRLAADERKRRKAKAEIARLRREITGWQPIETCPFAAYDRYYGNDRAVLFTDGESVSVSYIQKRFGRPIKCVKEPTMAFTDHGMAYVGGEYEEYDRPKWWFDYEFKDALEDDSDFGRPEISFVPTLWMPLPMPLSPDRIPKGGDAKGWDMYWPERKWAWTYDGSSDYSVGPEDDPQAGPIGVHDRDPDRGAARCQAIVDALNANGAEFCSGLIR